MAAPAPFIDCYRRGNFVLEAKKFKAGAHTKGFDDALLRARAQAEGYARALPAAEGRAPFMLVVDVGHVIELYAEVTRSSATYTPFPDSRSHRIRVADLHDGAVRERLRTLWTGRWRWTLHAPSPRSRARSPFSAHRSRAASKPTGTQPSTSRRS